MTDLSKIKERPILFNTEMVQALLDGRKTQTRRAIKHGGNAFHVNKILGEWGLSEPPQQWDGEDRDAVYNWMGKKSPQKGDWIWQLQCGVDDSFTHLLNCPYGKIGDELYVRESWWVVERLGRGHGNQFIIFDNEWDGPEVSEDAPLRQIEKQYKFGHHPSIHMSKELSRIQLRVKDIRVERVQDISTDDVWAEGLNKEEYEDWLDDAMTIGVPDGTTYERPKDLFQKLWDSINYKRGYGWDKNHWVWVVEFEVITKKGS